LLTIPQFWSPIWRIAVCAHTTFAEEVEGLDGILYEAAQNIVVFSNIQD
jgi:hypothetical protein